MIVNPWFWLGVLLTAGGIFMAGVHRGQKLERSDLADFKRQVAERDRDAEALATKDHRRRELAYSAADAEYQKVRRENEDLKASDRRRALAGDLRLQFRSRPTGVPAGSAERDAGATAELPREIAADLLDLANDADAVVRQLQACQQVIRADRETASAR